MTDSAAVSTYAVVRKSDASESAAVPVDAGDDFAVACETARKTQQACGGCVLVIHRHSGRTVAMIRGDRVNAEN